MPERPGVDDPSGRAFGNTTIGLVVTNARLTKLDCHLVAQSGHDAFGRALVPAHTRVDGDASSRRPPDRSTGDVPVDLVRLLAVAAMERRRSARSADVRSPAARELGFGRPSAEVVGSLTAS